MRSLGRRFGTATLWLVLVLVAVVAASALGVHPAQAATLAAAHPSAMHHLVVPGLYAMGMAGASVESDFVIYQAEFQSGMVESITQNIALFNEQTRGAIQLVPNVMKGDYSRNAFFKDVSGLVSRRDTTSNSGATILPMTQDEFVGVKLSRKVGPVGVNISAFRLAGLTEADASNQFGKLAGERKMQDMVNAAIRAVAAGVQSADSGGLVSDISGGTPGTSTAAALQTAIALFGDAAQKVVCWVSHSKPDNDIVAGLIAGSTIGLTDVATIRGSIPGYLGKPSVVTDSPALVITGTPDTYLTLGLVEGAVKVEESEPDLYYTQILPGNENLQRIFQSEHAYNVTVKGMKWDMTKGINPDESTAATVANWIQVATDSKNTAGVALLSK